MQIDHINIKAPEKLLIQEKDFLIQALHLNEGARPNAKSIGYWLHYQDNVVIHLSVNEDKQPTTDGYFDHIAFSYQGLQQFSKHLQNLGVSYTHQYIKELQLSQLFFTTPLGIKIEVNFANEILTS